MDFQKKMAEQGGATLAVLVATRPRWVQKWQQFMQMAPAMQGVMGNYLRAIEQDVLDMQQKMGKAPASSSPVSRSPDFRRRE